MYALVALLALVAGRRASRWSSRTRRRGVRCPRSRRRGAARLHAQLGAVPRSSARSSRAVVLRALARRRRSAARCCATALLGFGAIALLYLPWLPTLLFQAAHTGAPWAERPVARRDPQRPRRRRSAAPGPALLRRVRSALGRAGRAARPTRERADERRARGAAASRVTLGVARRARVAGLAGLAGLGDPLLRRLRRPGRCCCSAPGLARFGRARARRAGDRAACCGSTPRERSSSARATPSGSRRRSRTRARSAGRPRRRRPTPSTAR